MTKYFELKGGLGNQLFQYFAGQIVGMETSEEVVFGLPNMSRHRIHSSSTILDLDLPSIVNTEFIENNESVSSLIRGRQWLSRNSDICRQILNHYSKTYVSGTIGFDSDLFKFSRASFFEGYFQTYRYVSIFEEQSKLLISLKNPSPQYISYLSRMREKQPIVVHIRRGDYVSLKNSIGVIGANYYANAIRFFKTENPNVPVWLFTDDLVGAESVIRGLDTQFDEIVSAQSDLRAAETMLLMSQGSSIVIANSTFSWWAAYLGNYNSDVIAPLPWYRTNTIKSELIPLKWQLAESVWEN
jgi:hypothetical protein